MTIAAKAVRIFQAASAEGWRGHATASFFYGLLKLIRPRNKRIDLNLDMIYPEHKGDKKWHKNFKNKIYKNLSWTLTEILAAQRDMNKAFKWITKIDGLEYINEFLDDRKRGLLFLSGHFCNWELLAYWYSQFIQKHGGKLYIISQNMRDKDLSAIIFEYRDRSGIIMLPKQTSTLELVRLLKNGAHIAMLTDIAWTGGEILPFLGQPCTNTTGPATLSMLSGAPMITVGIYRLAPFRHKVKFLKPFQVPDGDNKLERIKNATIKVNNNFGEIIAQCPELWFWLHDRWKMRKAKK